MTDVVEPDRIASGQLLIERIQEDDAVSLVVHGEIDMASVPQLEHEIASAAESRPSQIILDMRGVTFLDSSGLRLLLTVQARAHEWRLVLRSVPDQAMRVFKLSGILDRLEIVD